VNREELAERARWDRHHQDEWFACLLRRFKKAAKTPRNQWITGTHADVRAMGRLNRETKTTSRRKTRG